MVCSRVLDRNGPLWNEARAVLEQELKQSGVYFSILEQLAVGERDVEEIASGARIENAVVSRYLATLAELRIVRRKLPVGAAASSRGGHWELGDQFLRFSLVSFRVPVPGRARGWPSARGPVGESAVRPALGDHVAPVFEDLCRDWTRTNYGRTAQRFGSWCGNARNDLRRAGLRSTEEVDIVGLTNGRVTVIGECRWRSKAMDGNILKDIEDYKLPALRQAGYEIDEHLQLLLFSRSGYNGTVKQAASANERLRLVSVAEIAG